MPTLHRRTGAAPHPQQTSYYIIAYPPGLNHITYQVHSRARDFIVETLDYTDEDKLSWSLIHPLRQIGDLFTLDEGGPQRADPDESNEVTTPELTKTEIKLLVDYLESHPDVVGNLEKLNVRLRAGESGYMDSIRRDGYTPTTTPGFSDGTGDETLDRIARKYCGEDSIKTIQWDGERITDFITTEDRKENTYHFPNIESRYVEAEKYRLSKDLYERWGPEIGESIVNSRRYEPGEEGFPNYWIGQRKNAPEPELDAAFSPRAFFYRTLAGRSNYEPGTRSKQAFEEVCDYSLEVYKANFPTAVDYKTLSTTFVTIEKATKPWEDFQVPPSWESAYDSGLPSLIRGEFDELPTEAVCTFIGRRTPGGEASSSFDSTTKAIKYFTAHRDMININNI